MRGLEYTGKILIFSGQQSHLLVNMKPMRRLGKVGQCYKRAKHFKIVNNLTTLINVNTWMLCYLDMSTKPGDSHYKSDKVERMHGALEEITGTGSICSPVSANGKGLSSCP